MATRYYFSDETAMIKKHFFLSLAYLTISTLTLLTGSNAWAEDTATPNNAGLERQEIRAQLSPRQYTTLAAEIGARISQLPLREGAIFKRGDLLVRFDCTMQQALLNKARAELTAAGYTYAANQRLASLGSVGNVELNLSEAAQQKARAEVGAQQAVLDKCSITAPFSGRIAEQKVREQQYVQPGQALLEILDDSVLELEFLVPSLWLGWIKPGLTFDVEIDETARRYTAKFTRIGARIDPVSQSIKVVAVIDGTHPELLSGMSGRVYLTSQQ